MSNDNEVNKFAFLIHPLDMKDVSRVEPKAANKRPQLVEKILGWMPVHKKSEITGIQSITGKRVQGWFIAVPYLPKHFYKIDRNIVIGRIIEGIKIAEDLGASIVGLGGFTSIVGAAGITVSKSANIAVTSGNSYTIATALEGSLIAAKKIGIDIDKAHIAVIGASGSIGKACAQFLVTKCDRMTLIARSEIRLEKLAEIIKENRGREVGISTNISTGIKDADIVITATSSTGNIVMAEDLKPGSVVCDVSLPHDVSREVQKLRPDVLVIEGGVVEVPGDVNFNYDFGYPSNVSLACMAETMILALEGRFENFSLGRGIKLEKVEEIAKLGKKHGFKLAGFRSFDQFIIDDKFDAIKKAASEKKASSQTI
ncbi:MAG: shikimate dehydrogenase [Candidatus Eremiobacteraeota bacterium]|nr:shikimate dehydrogenase [Candidatus Eremiobacteraeota bacterium]